MNPRALRDAARAGSRERMGGRKEERNEEQRREQEKEKSWGGWGVKGGKKKCRWWERQKGGRIVIPPSGTANGARCLTSGRARARLYKTTHLKTRNSSSTIHSKLIILPLVRDRRHLQTFATPHIGTSVLIINSDWTWRGQRIIAAATAGDCASRHWVPFEATPV